MNVSIAAVKKKDEDAARAREANRQEHIWKEQEAKRRAEEQKERERLEKMWAEQVKRRAEEAAARTTKQARAAQEARDAEERIQRDQAARKAQRAREAQQAQQAQQARYREHQPRVARAAAQTARNNMSRPATTAASTVPQNTLCRHDAFWPKMLGSHVCSNCHSVQRQFAFQCPGCKMIACANCRRVLRGERRSHRDHMSSGPRRAYYDDFGPASAHDNFDYDFD